MKKTTIVGDNCTLTGFVFVIRHVFFCLQFLINVAFLWKFCYLKVKILFVCVFTAQLVHLGEKMNFILMSFAFVKELTFYHLFIDFYSLFSYPFNIEIER